MNTLPILSFLIWLPIIGGLILLLLKQNTSFAKIGSLLFSLCSLSLCGVLVLGFDSSTWTMQWQEHRAWIPPIHVYYSLGVDGFSLPLIILNCFMTLLVVIANFCSVQPSIQGYLAVFLILQGLLNGAFAALDSILFYTFWEAMLVPLFLMIGIWGGANRIYATLKFFLYTFLGSVLLLMAILYLHIAASQSGVAPVDSFNILTFHTLPLALNTQKALFLAFLIAFAVKVPMWPVHTWLPDAHVEAPTGGSVMLAAILLKMGGYGFLRFLLPITPDASQVFALGMVGLSLVAIVYIALVAIVQKDLKTLIAYSSISHMGFVTLGIFVPFLIAENRGVTEPISMGIQGAMVQMISHGFISGALFFAVGALYERMHSRQIKDYGGVANVMPVFSAFFMLFALANIGVPGTSGFVGEFFIILSAFQAQPVFALFSASILILGATYTLWMIKRVILGPINNPAVAKLPDLALNEKIVFMLLAVVILGMGVWPKPVLDFIQSTSSHVITQMLHSKL
jgi:NADH-quinone oxidoreductase subunit M